jgi:hypothetical protein
MQLAVLTLDQEPRRSDSVWTRDCPLNRAKYAAAAKRRTGDVATITPETAGPDWEMFM